MQKERESETLVTVRKMVILAMVWRIWEKPFATLSTIKQANKSLRKRVNSKSYRLTQLSTRVLIVTPLTEQKKLERIERQLYYVPPMSGFQIRTRQSLLTKENTFCYPK